MFSLGQSGCIQAVVVVSGQSVCIWANVAVFGQKMLYSGKKGVFGQKWLYSRICCIARIKQFSENNHFIPNTTTFA